MAANAPRAHPQTYSLHDDRDDADRPSAATPLTPISEHQRKTYPRAWLDAFSPTASERLLLRLAGA